MRRYVYAPPASDRWSCARKPAAFSGSGESIACGRCDHQYASIAYLSAMRKISFTSAWTMMMDVSACLKTKREVNYQVVWIRA